MTGCACLVCIPFGLGSGHLPERVRAAADAEVPPKPALEVLAGIPTVVYGYFALTFMTPLLQDIGVGVGVFSALSAGLVMGVMLLPTVASVSEDSMSAVTRDLRDGAYALGSTRLHVSTRIVVPAAISGIIGVLRPRDLSGGGRDDDRADRSRRASRTGRGIARRGSDHDLVHAATGQGDVPTGSIEYKTIFAVGAALFVMTFVMNLFAIRLVRRFREVYE